MNHMGESLKIAVLLSKNLGLMLSVKKMNKSALAAKSGVSGREIQYILDQERSPSIAIVSDLARALNITVSALLSQDLEQDFQYLEDIQTLVQLYLSATTHGKENIHHTANQEARYASLGDVILGR